MISKCYCIIRYKSQSCSNMETMAKPGEWNVGVVEIESNSYLKIKKKLWILVDFIIDCIKYSLSVSLLKVLV